MKKSKNILECYKLKYLNVYDVHYGRMINLYTDWYTNDINKELGFEKNSWESVKAILEALPFKKKSHWNRLIKLKNTILQLKLYPN